MNIDEKLKKREKKLLLLHEVALGLASASKLEDLFLKVVETATLIADAEGAALFLLGENNKRLYLRAIKNFERETARIRFDDVTDRLGIPVINSKQTIIFNKEDFILATGIAPKSFLCISVSSKLEEIGILCVYNYCSEKVLSKDDEEFLIILAGYAATFIKNTILLGVANVKASTFSDLYEVSKLMLAEINLEKLLKIIVDNALRVLDADIVILYEYRKGIDDVKMPPIVKGVNIRDIDTIMRREIRHRESVVFKILERKDPFYASCARKDWSVFLQTEMQNNTDGRGDFIYREGIVSSAAVPLRIDDEPVGVLFINFRAYRPFREDRKLMIETFANEAALAIRNAKIFSQRDRYIKELSALNNITREISSGVTLRTHAILILIYEESGKLMDVTNFFVAFYDKETDNVSFELAVEKGQFREMGVGEWTSRKAGNGLTEYVIRNRKTLRVSSNIYEWLRNHEVDAIGEPVKSWLGTPMIYEEEVLGVIVIQDIEKENAYDQRHEWILETIASQAATAIAKARLFQKSQKQLDELNSLYKISQEIISKSTRIMSVLKTILGRAIQISNADAGEILFYDDSTGEAKVMLTQGLDAFKDLVIKQTEGITGRVIATGEAAFTNDYYASEYKIPRLDKPEYRKLIKGFIEVPLKWEKKLLGMIILTFKPGSKRVFSDKDIGQLNHFADSASIAITIARNISFRQIMLDDNPDAIIAVDRKGFITQFNKSSERIIGRKKEEVIGTHVIEFYYEGENEAKKINHILNEREKEGSPAKNIRTAVRGPNGENIPVLLSGVILRNELGEKIGSIGLMTALKEIEQLDEEYSTQQYFLKEIEHYPQVRPLNTQADLQERLGKILEKVHNFYNLAYTILFVSIIEDDTVLKAIAWTGIPNRIQGDLPHFNWRKAGLLPDGNRRDDTLRDELILINSWMLDNHWKDKLRSGIRGNNADFFKDISCGIPVRLADNYRAVLIFGPFKDNPDLLKIEGFLRNVAQTVNINALSWLQAINLRTKNKDTELARRLVIHRIRMHLQQASGKFGRIKKDALIGSSIKREAAEGEDLLEHLSSVLTRALTTHISEMEPEDYNFQLHPLPVLIQNSVEYFRERAHKWGRKLIIDPNVEFLPYAEIDPLMLSVALGNLIENALKYSNKNTEVKIFSEYDNEEAKIIVQDFGEEMSENARENLFRPGTRWGRTRRAKEIPGTGFGLWDSSVIANAHGGKLDFTSGYAWHENKETHIVKVWISIPLKHPKH